MVKTINSAFAQADAGSPAIPGQIRFKIHSTQKGAIMPQHFRCESGRRPGKKMPDYVEPGRSVTMCGPDSAILAASGTNFT
jgi:hypothetical protein